MTLAIAVAAALFIGVGAYAVFGGADFGSGFFDLTAGGDTSGSELRTLIDHSIGPVWEANHVWLIYVLVMWWTGFPGTFAAAMTTLIVPMFLALLGIVLRGAAFAFRKYSATLGQARLFGIVFAGSSLITPFFLGAVAGAIASGRVPADGGGDVWSSWLNPTSLFGGAIAVGTCCFLAGVFLTADASRAGHAALAEQLRRRTLGLGVVTGLVVFAALVPIERDAPTLAEGLEGRAAPLIIASGLTGAATLVLLFRRRYADRPPHGRGRGVDRGPRVGRGPVPVDAGRPGHHRAGGRGPGDADRAAHRRRASPASSSCPPSPTCSGSPSRSAGAGSEAGAGRGRRVARQRVSGAPSAGRRPSGSISPLR